ncbi:MAG: tRNA pseudouridine(38-40) synthase TruA [Planctomycetes bacterium]|nr:tRNA pseudouridine(38-40) synthase TruA [Planctomycetota bacterium]
MPLVRLTIAYDGADYHGWQRQEGLRTIQGEIERALRELTGEATVVEGAGRTDAGVHALAQVAAFTTTSSIAPERFAPALNARLPADIRARESRLAPEGFHPRFSARGKTYLYRVRTGSQPPLFDRRFVHHHRGALDLAAMRAGAAALVGAHDFRAFTPAQQPKEETVRTVRSIRLFEHPWGGEPATGRPVATAHLLVTGEGFLWNMVRIIAGTLLDVGRGRTPPGEVADILSSRDRRRAGPTLPARGLFLARVYY